MVFYGSNQPHQCNQEQEDAYGDDHTDHPEAGNQPETNAPCCDSNEQQTNQCVEQVQRTQAVLGTREAPANHLGPCGFRNRR